MYYVDISSRSFDTITHEFIDKEDAIKVFNKFVGHNFESNNDIHIAIRHDNTVLFEV